MAGDQPRGAWFEISPRSQPLSGRFFLGDGQVQEFSSWLELVALVERVWRAEPAGGDPPPAKDRG